MTDADHDDDECLPFEMFDPESQRPDNCECWGQSDLCCWYCYRAGFEKPNPNAPDWTPRDRDDPTKDEHAE